MASPQIDNGFTRLANEILQSLARTNLSCYERRFLDVVFLKTYGWGKKEDWISNSQFVEITGIKKSHISNIKNKLIRRGIIYSNEKKIGFQKDYEKWQKVTQIGNGVTQIGNKSYLNRGIQKKQETITKETHSFPKGKVLLTKSKETMKTVNYETGEVVDQTVKLRKNYEAIRLAQMFDEMASKASGIKINHPRSYFVVLSAMNKHEMKPKGIEKLFEDWFNQDKVKLEDKVKLNFALSASNINSWKIANRI